MPKISVIVPVLNGEKYISECIDSILNQSLNDLEVIIVDAGSTDKTINIINEYACSDERVILVNSPRKSMGYQYNLGIELAKGDYVGFCESDDLLDVNMFEHLHEAITNSEADYIKADFDMFVDKNERVCLRYNILNDKELYGKVLNPREHAEILMRDVNMWNGLYKTSFAKGIILNDTLGAAFQDSGFVVKSFLNANKIMYISGPSYFYRRDNLGSSVYSPKTISFVEQEFSFIFDYINNSNRAIDGFERAIILRRFLDMFGGFYNYLPVLDQVSYEIIESINKFTDRFIEEYNNTEYQYLEALDFFVLINSRLIVQRKMELFDEFRREVALSNITKWTKFLEEVSKYKKVVFTSASEGNRCACAFLINNDIESDICFATFEEAQVGNSILGNKVLNSEVIEDSLDTVYIIDRYNTNSELYRSLLDKGVDKKRIYKTVKITPHAAFEVVV